MTANLPSADVYTKITEAGEKARLLKDLVNSKGDVLIKRFEPEADVYTTVVVSFQNQILSCRFQTPKPDFTQNGDLIVYFFIGGEKYFYHSTYVFEKDLIQIKTDNAFYHLQRREDYRIRIPSSFRALLEIVSVTGKYEKHSIPILDLSGGGCRVQLSIDKLNVKVYDEIKGHLFLPDRAPIEIVGSIRHMKIESRDKNIYSCGIQFVGMSEQIKNRIIALVLDLYREFFSGRN